VGALLVTNGVAARRMSHEQFGFWAILLSMMFLAMALDFGFRYGLGNRLAALGAVEDSERQRKEAFFAIFSLEVMIAVCSAVGCVLIFPFIPWAGLFKIENPDLARQAGQLMPVIVVLLLSYLPFSLAGTAFFAYLEIGAASFFVGAQAVLIMLVFLATVGWLSFPHVVILYYSAYLATGVASTLWLLMRRGWRIEWTPLRECWKILVSMAQPSLQFFALSLCATITGMLGTMVSGAVSGLAAAGDFNLVQRIFSLLLTLHLAFLAPIAPLVTREARAGNWEVVRGKLHQCLTRVWPLMFPLLGAALWLAHPLLIRLWAGKWVTDYFLAGLLLLWVCLSGLGNTYSVILNSLGLVRVQAIIALVLMAPVIFLPVVLGRVWGLYGIALAGVLSTLPVLLILPRYTKNALANHKMRV
jgi:O-antigen/teichoic acid export membrane protein